jgi:nitrite reductase/ring-hydroxylating ferredoxin subunit
MAFARAGSLEEVQPGTMLELETETVRVAVCNVEGELYAIDGTCPHRGGQLAYGALHGKTVVCPWHGWEFDCRTGHGETHASIRLRRFDVKVEDGEVFVDVK